MLVNYVRAAARTLDRGPAPEAGPQTLHSLDAVQQKELQHEQLESNNYWGNLIVSPNPFVLLRTGKGLAFSLERYRYIFIPPRGEATLVFVCSFSALRSSKRGR